MGVSSTYVTEAAAVTYEPDRERIARELREQIADGTLRPGDQLPSARQLAATYQVSSKTAQDAVRVLREEQIVEGRKGRGVYVLDTHALMALATGSGKTESLVEVLARQEKLEQQVAELRARQEATEAGLRELADRLGQPRPGQLQPDQPPARRRKTS